MGWSVSFRAGLGTFFVFLEKIQDGPEYFAEGIFGHEPSLSAMDTLVGTEKVGMAPQAEERNHIVHTMPDHHQQQTVCRRVGNPQ